MSAADRRWDDLSRLLENWLFNLLFLGLNNFGFSHGLKELLAFVNFERSDGSLLQLGLCVSDRRFSGSYIFGGRGDGVLLHNFLKGGGVTLFETGIGCEIGGDIFAVTVSLDHLGSF